jgi:hypothetical protein
MLSPTSISSLTAPCAHPQTFVTSGSGMRWDCPLTSCVPAPETGPTVRPAQSERSDCSAGRKLFGSDTRSGGRDEEDHATFGLDPLATQPAATRRGRARVGRHAARRQTGAEFFDCRTGRVSAVRTRSAAGWRVIWRSSHRSGTGGERYIGSCGGRRDFCVVSALACRALISPEIDRAYPDLQHRRPTLARVK